MFSPPPPKIPHVEECSQVAPATIAEPIIEEVGQISFDEAVSRELRDEFGNFVKYDLGENCEAYLSRDNRPTGTWAFSTLFLPPCCMTINQLTINLKTDCPPNCTQYSPLLLNALSKFDPNETIQNCYLYGILKLRTENPVEVYYFVVNQRAFRFELQINPNEVFERSIVETMIYQNL